MRKVKKSHSGTVSHKIQFLMRCSPESLEIKGDFNFFIFSFLYIYINVVIYLVEMFFFSNSRLKKDRVSEGFRSDLYLHRTALNF